MKISIFGGGYVGLVQAAVLSEVGHDVTCVDINPRKVDALNRGLIPIYEPGLDVLVKQGLSKGLLTFTIDAEEAIQHATAIFIAVGTPPDEDGSADLQHVLKVAETIAQYMNEYKVIINKSTVPVGTGARVKSVVREQLKSRNVICEFDVVSNPEFLKEGAAVADCQRPDRIVIGVESDKAANIMREIYEHFNRNHEKIIQMDIRSAELTKYAANCMLATKISFMNEMANLAEKLGADIESVRQGIGSDPRIGYHFIYPGCGYGGSCFPKDINALLNTSRQVSYDAKILKAVDRVNQKQKQVLFNKLHQVFNGDLVGRTIALWGLSFKPETDDTREATSLVLINALLEAGVAVQAYDPQARAEVGNIYGDQEELTLTDKKEDALIAADALVIVTEWKEFRSPNFELIQQSLNYPIIVDGRNLYSPQKMKQLGFIYYGVGRGESIKKQPAVIMTAPKEMVQ
ncbi:UDP-glucose/GDP-mannose dehydrogenase family protein [Bermanella marisrubri]|uniref:UDP-glucose 6-dehydrogenase n=1 Tax=Bermanella marisrubri TaxID=207949 RepID=Q1N088_9GAMM|nr:UDP-glucose/GDP-mannose dehydrogenase family protein [Bermanella marisrubri]EAT11629.1 predicted UDP-glucose 6-dehydrogenase [Oceanobacter sp. RED65] [Bermanella marisrubri]QIZ83328.1 UDP-glucose/GDP-mannose dehydrogenase family protein [Bermanella marisrubri]